MLVKEGSLTAPWNTEYNDNYTLLTHQVALASYPTNGPLIAVEFAPGLATPYNVVAKQGSLTATWNTEANNVYAHVAVAG